MPEIRIYDPPTVEAPTFRPLGLVLAATDVTLIERHWSPGSFTLSVPLGARHEDRLTGGRLLLVDGTFWGIIDGFTLEASSSGYVRTVSGRQLKGLTLDRITIPPESTEVTGAQGYDAVTGSTETIMKHFVTANMAAPVLAARKVFGLEVASDQGRGLAEDKYMSRHEVVSDVLAALGEAAELGYDILPDLKRHAFVFDVVPGEDHTAQQSDRTRVIFDIRRRTAQAQTYSCSGSDARNVFYTTMSGSEFADETLTVSYIRDSEQEAVGIRRRETHLSVSVDTPEAGTEYDELKRQAMIAAEQYKAAESFTCELRDDRYVYGRDYRLGDLVTCCSQDWGVEMHTRLTEMQTVWSSAGIQRTATFGTAPLTIFGRLRRQIREQR